MRDYLLHELVVQRMQNHFRNGALDFGGFNAEESAAFESIGVVRRTRLTPLERAMSERLNVSREMFNLMPPYEAKLGIEADLVFEAWFHASDGDLVLSGEGNLDVRTGEPLSRQFVLMNNREVPNLRGFFFVYQQHPGYACFVRYADQETGEVQWYVTVRGATGGKLLSALQERVNRFLIERYRGQAINHHCVPLVLKGYGRDELVYPPALGRQIDDLLVSFRHWQAVESKVARWGTILIGPPGTGKTTIGGLLAAARSPDCTFLYFPAADVQSASQIRETFKLARLLTPCVLQIDDVDLIAVDRSQDHCNFTSTLMECLDGLEESAKIFVILTTNDPSKMDPAVIDRAGRVSTKLVFTGFGEVAGELIVRHARSYGLRIAEQTILQTTRALKDVTAEFTPDEAKNVCQRLHLLHGDADISAKALTEAIRETAASFHSQSAKESFLPRRSNGASHPDPNPDY